MIRLRAFLIITPFDLRGSGIIERGFVVLLQTKLALVFAVFAVVPSRFTAAAEVAATKLDGTVLNGELRDWSSDQVTLATSDGESPVNVDDLLSLRWPSSERADSAKLPAIELVDGTVLPIDEYTSKRGTARVTLRHSSDVAAQEIDVTAKAVTVVRLKPLEGELAAQWDEVRKQDFASDVLVVLKRDGKSLDYVEGLVGDITKTHVKFKIDDQSLDVDRAKVAGAAYFRGDSSERTAAADPQCVLRGDGGLNANAKSVKLADGMLKVQTLGGVEFKWPLLGIQLADFSAGKLVFLSDLNPASESWTPLVALPPSVKLANEFGKPRRDQSAYGGPLALRGSGNASEEDAHVEQTFNKGLAIRSRSEIVYRLPRGFRRFLAVAGIEPATNNRGDVFLSIDGDGRRLLEIQVAGDQSPHEIELDIEDVKRLTIVVDYGQNLDTGDWLNLCNARILK